MSDIPYIDPTVKHVPVSYLRRMNMQTMRDQSDALVVDGFDGEEPLVVILPFKTFLLIQEALTETVNSNLKR